MSRQLLPVAFVLFAVTTTVAEAGNWPQFRGPHRDAVVKEAFPMHWDTESNVRWKTKASGEAGLVDSCGCRRQCLHSHHEFAVLHWSANLIRGRQPGQVQENPSKFSDRPVPA